MGRSARADSASEAAPSQSASLTALPQGEPRGCSDGKKHFSMPYDINISFSRPLAFTIGEGKKFVLR